MDYTKKEFCPCGSPQSHPIPHEHDRTEREHLIIGYYENKLNMFNDLYEACKLVDNFFKLGNPLGITGMEMKVAIAKALTKYDRSFH